MTRLLRIDVVSRRPRAAVRCKVMQWPVVSASKVCITRNIPERNGFLFIFDAMHGASTAVGTADSRGPAQKVLVRNNTSRAIQYRVDV